MRIVGWSIADQPCLTNVNAPPNHGQGLAPGGISGDKPRAACPTLLCALVALACYGQSPLDALPGDLIRGVPASVGVQDLTQDQDGTFWVTSFLDDSIEHYSADLSTQLDDPINSPAPNGFTTGIAYNSLDDTLFVTGGIGTVVTEIDRTGELTGRAFQLQVVSGGGRFFRGLAFDPTGNNRNGSLYAVEFNSTLIYEFDLSGNILRTFEHPDDPDGFPGTGLKASTAGGIDLIFEANQLAGFYVTGGPPDGEAILRLNVDGTYSGVAVSACEAGGSISGVVRRTLRNPQSGANEDVFVCVVESNAELILLEAGPPPQREVRNLECVVVQSEARLTWTNFDGGFDSIEIWHGCERLDVLPGDAAQWSRAFPDGVYDLRVSPIVNGESAVRALECTAVVGPGQVENITQLPSGLYVDIALSSLGFVVLTEARAGVVHILDTDLTNLETITMDPQFLMPGDFLTGVAIDTRDDTIYVLNATQSKLGKLEAVGALDAIIDLQLPDLADPDDPPDLGFGLGLTFDANGANGAGSIWVVESVADVLYEVALDGTVLNAIPHPYLAAEARPVGVDLGGISASGIDGVPGEPNQLYVSGGTFSSRGRQLHILRVDKSSGASVPGSEISLRGVREAAGTSGVTFAALPDGQNLLTIPVTARIPQLIHTRSVLSSVQPPTFFSSQQPGYKNDVHFSFTNPGGYDRLELFRDCAKVSDLPGDAESATDLNVASGFHNYRLRGVRGAESSDFAHSSLQTGPGAVLIRASLWPVARPEQMAIDPFDGRIYVWANRVGDERRLFVFDRNFRFIESLDTSVPAPLKIFTFAIRQIQGDDRELAYIAGIRNPSLDLIGREEFRFITDTMDGERKSDQIILTPRPTGPFVTFPTGLTWSSTTDSYYYLGRNSNTFVEMSPDGQLLREFAHPDPPFRNFIFNLGVDFSAQRGTLFFTTSDRKDRHVTFVQEMSLAGELTGVRIPVGHIDSSGGITGIAVEGSDLVAIAETSSGAAEIYRVKAFEELPTTFRRGEINGDGVIDLADALRLLNHLFSGQPAPRCEKAADIDDGGVLDISDAIQLLRHLFVAGDPPAEPYNEPGIDPTPDGLRCE